MKKLLCFIICILTALFCVGCKKNSESEIVSIAEMGIDLITKDICDSYEFTIVDDNGTVWVEHQDMKEAGIVYKEGQNRYLEIRFTQSGAKKFRDAIKETQDGTLSLMMDGEVLASPILANEIIADYAKITGPYSDVAHWFNMLT